MAETTQAQRSFLSQVEYASRSGGMDSQKILTFSMGKNLLRGSIWFVV